MDIIPKIAPRPPLWLNFLFYFSIILFAGSLIGVFYFRYSNSKAVNSLAVFEEQIAISQADRQALEDEVSLYRQKIDDFAVLLESRKAALNFFPFLEKVCHPKVRFTELTLSLKDYKAGLSGQAESFEALEQQMAIFEKDTDVKGTLLSRISIIREGQGADFSLNIALSPGLFR